MQAAKREITPLVRSTERFDETFRGSWWLAI